MKRTSDVTALGTVVYSVSISTTTFTLRSRTSLGSSQMNSQSKASKSDLPRSLEMKTIFNGCLVHGCVRNMITSWTVFNNSLTGINIRLTAHQVSIFFSAGKSRERKHVGLSLAVVSSFSCELRTMNTQTRERELFMGLPDNCFNIIVLKNISDI